MYMCTHMTCIHMLQLYTCKCIYVCTRVCIRTHISIHAFTSLIHAPVLKQRSIHFMFALNPFSQSELCLYVCVSVYSTQISTIRSQPPQHTLTIGIHGQKLFKSVKFKLFEGVNVFLCDVVLSLLPRNTNTPLILVCLKRVAFGEHHPRNGTN